MSRYLTPAKIALLALIEVYVEGAVPNEAIIGVLSFIASHVVDHSAPPSATQTATISPTSPSSSPTSSPPQPPPPSRWSKQFATITLLSDPSDFERLLSPHHSASGLPGRRLWDVFLSKLWAIDSLHAVHDFLDRRPLCVAKTKEELRALAASGTTPPSPEDPEKVKLAPNSPFGAFVRRCVIEFRRLKFQDACGLWSEYVRYRQGTAGYWRRRSSAAGGAGRLSFDSVLFEGQHDWGEGVNVLATVTYGEDMLPAIEGVKSEEKIAVSFDDVEKLLEFQVHQMQKLGGRMPAELRAKVSELLRNSYAVPALSHYVKYLEAWKSGDHPTSFDYLHQYFDYVMQAKDRLAYQHALMNLAVLRNEFGAHREALSAMLETVSTARENRDESCLNFALSWLFHFGKAHPDLVSDLDSKNMLGTGKESLNYLRTKAKESRNFALWCSTLLSDAKLALSKGDSVATAHELMMRSSHTMVQNNMKGYLGAQMAMHTAIWDRLGVSYLSQSYCDVFLKCYTDHAMFDDELKLVCRLSSSLALQGRYNEAFDLLDNLDKDGLSSWKAKQYWHEWRGLLKLRRCLHHNDLDAAEQLLNQLRQTQPDDLEPDLSFVIEALNVEYLMRRKDLSAAFERVEHMLNDALDHDRDISIRIRLLLLKAQLFDKAGRPQKGFTISMQAASMSWRARIMPTLWQSIGSVANILNSMGEFEAAANVMDAVIPRYLECGSAYLTGQLYSFLADAYIGLAGSAPTNGPTAKAGAEAKPNRRREYLVKAHGTLDQALAHFAAVEDLERQCETLAKKATILKVAGDVMLAKECAVKYLELRRQVAAVVR